MSIPIEDDPPPGGGGGSGGGGGGGEVIPGELPGLGGFLRRRYTCNVLVNEEISVVDLLNKVIFTTSRHYMTQGANGKVRLNTKKPVDWGQGLTAFDIGDTVIELDDVSRWIDDLKYYLLIDPHTDESEVRVVTDADYSIDQNSVTLTTSHPADIDIVGFSGGDGDSTPATAVITILSFVATTEYTVTLDGIPIVFTTEAPNTLITIAAFLSGVIMSHPSLNRRYSVLYVEGDDFLTITPLFGTLTLNTALTKQHIAPEADPVTAPTLALSTGTFPIGELRVSYTFKNEHGQTLPSPYKAITLTALTQVDVSTVSPPAGMTVCWYASVAPDASKFKFIEENDGSAFSISVLPKLNAALPPDLNRTGTEVMRVKAVFSDREEARSGIGRSNVLRGEFEWFLGTRNKRFNVVELKYRDQGQDYRLTTLRLRDDAHIAKIHKEEKLEVNGQGIDNYFQAYRIAAGLLGEQMEADFFYKWASSREALLLEEGDVVAITDNGSGVINFPVWIETIDADLSGAGMPKVSFTARKYANSLWDDSVVERTIPIVTEGGAIMPGAEAFNVIDGADNVVEGADQIVDVI